MRAVKLYDNNLYGYLIVSEGPPMRFKEIAHTLFPKKQNYSYMENTRSFTEFLSVFFIKCMCVVIKDWHAPKMMTCAPY